MKQTKFKSTAIVLAVFLGFWTWCYTYQKDNVKFWIGFSFWVAGGILTIGTLGVFGFLYFPGMLALNIWAIVDQANKDKDYWKKYPK